LRERIVSIYCAASSPLDFDAVIAAIVSRYPGTHIVEADWYAERRAKEVAVCERTGTPIPNPPLDSLDRVWAEKGLQRGFEVPIREGLKLYARLDKTGGYFFHRAGEFNEDEVLPLIEILQRFGLSLRYFSDSGRCRPGP
jgi:hypothetical protein